MIIKHQNVIFFGFGDGRIYLPRDVPTDWRYENVDPARHVVTEHLFDGYAYLSRYLIPNKPVLIEQHQLEIIQFGDERKSYNIYRIPESELPLALLRYPKLSITPIHQR